MDLLKPIALSVTPDLALYHIGPPLDLGPMPSLFYFALSGPDSLALDPFNQPVQFLLGKGLRVFSLTLPAHENNLPRTEALRTWAEDYAKGLDPLAPFLDDCENAIAFALRERFILPEKMAIAGLSRGGFAALHLAAREPKFHFCLAFAPIIKLGHAKEFQMLNGHPKVQSYDACRIAEMLVNRHLRIYIGNRDTRVSTRECFEVVSEVVEQAFQKKIRSPQVELFLTPSIGAEGHGTSPEVFAQGAEWIASCLKVK